MSLSITAQISHVAFALAVAIEDLQACKTHKLSLDDYWGRHALARFARDKKAEVEALMGKLPALTGDDASALSILSSTIADLRAERAHFAKVKRERREAQAAERALLAQTLAA